MKHAVNPEFDPAIHSEFAEAKMTPMAAKDARAVDGLVWWRPDGVISEIPDNDTCLVR